jgi:hypothetical protein
VKEGKGGEGLRNRWKYKGGKVKYVYGGMNTIYIADKIIYIPIFLYSKMCLLLLLIINVKRKVIMSKRMKIKKFIERYI